MIAQRIEAEVLNQAVRKATSENNTRREPLEGEKLHKVYEKYGVL